jgi:hypothetical protein
MCDKLDLTEHLSQLQVLTKFSVVLGLVSNQKQKNVHGETENLENTDSASIIKFAQGRCIDA